MTDAEFWDRVFIASIGANPLASAARCCADIADAAVAERTKRRLVADDGWGSVEREALATRYVDHAPGVLGTDDEGSTT